jgi:malonyl-CoA O-methyltransferase
MAIVLSVREGYDRWSELYDGDGNPLCMLEEPHVDRLLGDVRQLAVADIGCGTGRHALRFASHGARVTAVDFSAGMLAKARAKPGAEQITWVEHDLTSELPFAAATFDRVVCALVVDHIRELRAFFAELRRITRPGGFVVVSVMHPGMMLKGTQARFHDPTTGQEVRPESVAHQVSDYVMAAVRAGLVIDEMSEHFVDAELVKQASRAEKYLGWPMLLLFRFAC